jgi:hypothetical protein
MRAQRVVATPSDINLFSKGGVYNARETGEAFRDAEDRHVEPLEGGTVVASDWAGMYWGPASQKRRGRSTSRAAVTASLFSVACI